MTSNPTRRKSPLGHQEDSTTRSEATIKLSKKMIALAKRSLEQTKALEETGLSKENLAKVLGELPPASQAIVKRVKNLETIAEKKAWLKFLKDSGRAGTSPLTNKKNREVIKI